MLYFLVKGARAMGVKEAGAEAFAFELDAALREDHHFRAEVTDNPLEDGTSISDHIVNQPVEVRVEYLVSNSPLKLFAWGGEDRVQNVIDAVMALRDSRALVTLVSGLQVYEDMAITDIHIPIRSHLGQALWLHLDLKQVKKVTSDQVIMAGNTSSEQAMPTQNAGTQTPTTVN